MLGYQAPNQGKLFYTDLDIESRIRADHPLKRLNLYLKHFSISLHFNIDLHPDFVGISCDIFTAVLKHQHHVWNF